MRLHRWKWAVSPKSTGIARLLLLALLLGAWCVATTRDADAGQPLLTPAEQLWLKDNGSLLVLAVETGYPPFAFLDAEGNPAGLANDYLLAIEAKLGVRFKRQRFPSLDEILAGARAGTVQVVNAVTSTPRRSEFLSFTRPFISVPNVIIVRKERQDGMAEKNLAGLKVSLVKSYAVTEKLVASGIGLVPELVPDDLSAILNVSFGRSDAAVIDLATATYLISQKGITNLRVAGEASSAIHLAMAVPHAASPLRDILQKGMDALTASEREKILQRWIHASGSSALTRRFWISLAAGTLAIVAVMTGVLLWNMTLRRLVAARTDDLAREKEALREREERYRQLVDSLQNVVVYQIIGTPDGKREFSYISRAVERLNECSVEEVLADASVVYRQMLPEYREMVARCEEEALCNLTPLQVEVQSRLPSGKLRWFEFTSAPRFRGNGQLIWDGIEMDITERKESEEKRSLLEQQLLQAQKLESIGRLAGGVAHDFNNMLGVILGHAELGMMRLHPKDRVYEDLREIKVAAERSAQLTRQLLAFARKQMIEPKVLDLNRSISQMLNMLQRLIGEGITLSWHPAPHLWHVKVDPSQLDQILANLCVNARDAIENSGAITFRTENRSVDDSQSDGNADAVPGEYVCLMISDDGAGMDTETVSRVFEPFFTTKDIGRGTGLGLATVYGAVRQNDGFIEISSAPGTGTTFYLYFPRHRCEVDRDTAEESAPTPPRGEETILLVEDEEGILGISTDMLKIQGYQVLPANGPAEARRLAREHEGTIDLILTDVIMPETNGSELAREIAVIRPGIRPLFMSGYTADIIAQHGVLAEGIQFIQKPFTLPALAAKVREVLDGEHPASTATPPAP